MANATTAATLISSTVELEAFVSSIQPSSTIYLDLEGNGLSRYGTISFVSILIYPQRLIRLVDVFSLGELAFTTVTNDGRSLKSIFEDSNIPKCLWDVRNDADALWALYRIGLNGVIDVQLLENASRVGDKTHLWGLAKAIRLDLNLRPMELSSLISTKKDIKSLMPAKVFDARPVEAKTVQYCTNDIVHLPALHSVYFGRIGADWLAKAKEESLSRVNEAHSPAYKPRSATKMLGPWGSGTGKSDISWDDLMDELQLEMDQWEMDQWGVDGLDEDQ